MEEFDERLQCVETDSQRQYVMLNLPFSAESITSQPNPMKNQKQERQFGWHRCLEDVPKYGLSIQASYGWLEYQYLECESLMHQMRTATQEERLILEEKLAVVMAE